MVAGAFGLSIVRAVVTAHRGTVTAASRPGGGLSVTVELPASDYPPSASTTSS